MKELDFDKDFNVQLKGMKINGCHPKSKRGKVYCLLSTIVFGEYTLYFFLLISCMKHYIMLDDYFNALRNGVPITFYICMTLDNYLFIKNQTTLANLINVVKEDYAKMAVMDIRQKATMFEYATKGQHIMYRWLYTMIASLFIFNMKTVFLTIYYRIRNGEFEFVPFYVMYYPFNFDEYRMNNLYAFALTYFGEMFFATTTVVIHFCAVPLGPIFMLHTCGQLELIKFKFENIFKEDNVDEKLKEIVQNLQHVYKFVAEVNKCFTLTYEVMLKQTMLLLPVSGYAIVKSLSHGDLTIEYLTVFVASLFTSSIPCYYSDLLIQKGEEIRQAAYECGWECVNKNSARKTLLIILARALKPVAIKSIFCTINLDTLANVYRQSYTIFNLMSAMWD